MQKARFIIALAVFLSIAFALPFLANLLPDHTRTLANAPEIISRAYIDRVVNYVVSGKKPDMVVAGSSLVISPHVLTDGYFEKVPVPVPDPFEYADFLSNYVEMAHFKKLYAQTSAGDVLLPSASIVDLGVPSLMLSDCDLLFEKLQHNDALPETVVLLLAPRDFMDNTVAAERNLFMHEINGRITLKELFNSVRAQQFFANLYSAINYGANAWCKQFRSGGQRVALAIKKLGRKPRNQTLAGGPSREKALHHFYFGDGKLSDLAVYQKRYNPPDHVRIKEQLAAMAKLLARLKANSVRIVVVSMPLTPRNIALIDKDAHTEILEGMRSVCKACAVPSLTEEDFGTYENSDFVDSVHLNVIGGDKFFRRLAGLISSRARD
ncbi:MAG: hypothetical protein IT342_16960 [Candidatus Melainabacteria bacterium]|nr:hypothetical protein [Candidatus Melainabacteria bacterium]